MDSRVASLMDAVTRTSGNPGVLLDTAALVNLRSDYLARLFRQEAGNTFSTYCRGVRLAQARELLAGFSHSVKEIAYALGYKNPANFTRAYRRLYRESPRASRTLLRSVIRKSNS